MAGTADAAGAADTVDATLAPNAGGVGTARAEDATDGLVALFVSIARILREMPPQWHATSWWSHRLVATLQELRAWEDDKATTAFVNTMGARTLDDLLSRLSRRMQIESGATHPTLLALVTQHALLRRRLDCAIVVADRSGHADEAWAPIRIKAWLVQHLDHAMSWS